MKVSNDAKDALFEQCSVTLGEPYVLSPSARILIMDMRDYIRELHKEIDTMCLDNVPPRGSDENK